VRGSVRVVWTDEAIAQLPASQATRVALSLPDTFSEGEAVVIDRMGDDGPRATDSECEFESFTMKVYYTQCATVRKSRSSAKSEALLDRARSK